MGDAENSAAALVVLHVFFSAVIIPLELVIGGSWGRC